MPAEMREYARGSWSQSRYTTECRSVPQGGGGEYRHIAEEIRARLAKELPCEPLDKKMQADVQSGRSLALSGTAFDLDRDHRLIVKGFHALGMFGDRLEDRLHHAVSRLLFASCDQFFDAGAAKQIPCLVARVEY